MNGPIAIADEKCRVVIVGAGASGLYCAHLLQKHGVTVVVLEARNRIGGRIYSAEQDVRTATQNESTTTKVIVDHGAAWVHGTGYEWGGHHDKVDDAVVPQAVNPMMELLVEAKGTTEELHEHHMRPICIRGNPWVRPKHVLHDTNEIVLYVAGQRLEKDDPVIDKALKRHFYLLNQVSEVGDQMFQEERGMDTVFQSLEATLTEVKQRTSHALHEEGQDSVRIIEALTKLYLYILTCWYGAKPSELQLSEFTSRDCEKHDAEYMNEGDFYGPHCTLRDGMKTVLEPLLSNGGAERVQCGQEVVRIQETPNNTVVVETKTGMAIEAECCVVTISVGCLQADINNGESVFHPSLSHEKHEVRRVWLAVMLT
jgi:hypothetical protein